MSVRLSCPSCNTAFTLPALPDHRRATCPRCGDVFPVRTYTEDAEGARGSEPEAPAASPTGPVPQRHAWRARGGGFYALLGVIGLVILGAGIAAGLRARKGGGPANDAPSAQIAAVPAAQVTGLGYLRPDSDIVFVVRPEPLVSYADRTQQAPNAVLARTGLPEPTWSAVEQLGVPLAQIDHLAGGAGLGEGEDALRLALVLVLKQPLADEDEFLRKLKARAVAGKKSRHDVVVGRFPLLLTRVSPTVWVFGYAEPDLDAAETGGYGPGGTQFRGDERSGLRGALATVPPDAAVWVAADDDRGWAQKPIVKLLENSPELKKWRPTFRDGRGGALAVSLGERPRLWLRVRTADSATGERVRAYFAARAMETESATAGGDGAVAQFEAPFDPTTTGKLLQRFLSDADR